MAKSKKRQDARAKRNARKAANYTRGNGMSRYAIKHRGGGNTGPNGMWRKVDA